MSEKNPEIKLLYLLEFAISAKVFTNALWRDLEELGQLRFGLEEDHEEAIGLMVSSLIADISLLNSSAEKLVEFFKEKRLVDLSK